MVKVKGSVLIDAIQWARKKYGDDQIDRRISLMSPESRSIFLGEITRTAWYPLDAYVNFLELGFKENYKSSAEYLIEATGEPVERQLRGIYALIIKLGSPEFLIKRLPVVTTIYFQGVEAKPTISAPGKATVIYIGFEKQHSIIQYLIMGFLKKALEISGAKNVKTAFNTQIADGKEYSEQTISWDPK